AGQGVLLNGQRVQARTEPVRLLPPVRYRIELAGELRFPESDMANTANTKDGNQFGSAFFHLTNLSGIVRQLILQGKVPLSARDRQTAQRTVEGLLHGVLERTGVIRR